ncbi:zinc finger and BTB domain-containing protein 14-like [Brachionichthys hirsutus]|uniref:zinc finger and BTB domain-containing protein 14-like n=1 Tax=Brachionichthys hirsutus TaxID=412623 RepID=UPI00360461DC
MSDLLRYIDYDHKATFLKMLNQQRMEGEHCDVVVVVENIEFRAHRCVLAACSNYFKKLFKKQSDEDNSIVELDFIRSDIFEEVLNYMYTARLAVRKKDINMMMSSGQILGINFLDNLCTQKRELTNMKTRENQAPGDHGMRAQDAILKELAMEEVRKNSFYDQGMDGMGPGGSHVSQPHGYNSNMSKDPHAHSWGSSSSSDMKLEYLLYGHRDHGSCQSAGTKPLDHNAKKERLLTANRPYGCEHCPKAFTTAAHLKEHLKIHSGFKPHRCVVCGKAFIRGPDLKRHERVHSNERPFACQMCEKAFKHKSHLKDHERQHRGERPFNCGSCDKAFIKASDLKRHWNTMHSGNPRRQMSSQSPAASQHGQGDAADQRDWKMETGAHSQNSGDC